MPIRIKLRGDKAIIRFGNQAEENWFRNMMRSIRDSDPNTHPKISVKDAGGELPQLPKPKVEVTKGTPMMVPPEMKIPVKMETKK